MPRASRGSNRTATVVTTASNSNDVKVELTPTGGGPVSARFQAPTGQSLGVGAYEGAQQYPTDTSAALTVVIGADGCGGGRFVIDAFGVSGPPDAQTVDTFSARFELHCVADGPGLFGATSVNSDIDFRTRTVGPNSVDFPVTQPGGTSVLQPVTITNHGPSALTVSSATITGTDAGQFGIVDNDCGILASSASCTIRVSFTPNGLGQRSAKLAVFDDLATTGGAGRVVVLTGTGIDPTGEFTALTPTRIVDTRIGTGGRLGVIGTGRKFDVQITGACGIPSAGVSAIVLNSTVTQTTAASYLTVWPAGVARPVLSNLNYVPGQTVPNLVIAKVGFLGVMDFFNYAGCTHLVIDAFGIFTSEDAPAPSSVSADSTPPDLASRFAPVA
jgi:hypothetical protein